MRGRRCSWYSRFEQHFRSAISNQKALYILATVAIGFVFPAIMNGVMEGSNLEEWLKSPLIWLIGPMHIALTIVLTVRPELTSDFYFRYRDTYKANRKKSARINQLLDEKRNDRIADNTLRLTFRATFMAVNTIRSLPVVTTDELHLLVAKILELIVVFRNVVLSFEKDDLWSFAVYMHDPDTGELSCFFRDCQIGRAPTNRSWRPGRGHVGQCFIQNRAIVTEDVNEAHIFRDDQMNDDDRNTYVSMASAPIRRQPYFGRDGEEDGKAIGVLVVTSSRSGQFSERLHKSVVEDLAFLLSEFFSNLPLSSSTGGQDVVQE